MPELAKNSGASHRNTSTPGCSIEAVAPGSLCQPSRPRYPAEHLAVRPPVPLEEQQDRQHDGDEDALEDAEEDDTCARDEREHHRRPSDLPHSGEDREVGEGERRRDDHCGQRRVRQVGEQSVEEQAAGAPRQRRRRSR